MHVSILFHAAQAVLAPVTIWATVENGIIAGAAVLVIIGLLELVDILFAPKGLGTKLYYAPFRGQ